LSALGKKQATALATSFSDAKIAAIFTSPMERTLETATIIGSPHGIHPIIDTRLLEVRSPLEGKTLAEIETLGGWNWQIYETPWYASMKGETLAQIQARIVTCIEEKRKEYQKSTVVLVSHGDPIMLASAYYQGIPVTIERMAAMQPYVSMSGGYKIEFPQDPRSTSIKLSPIYKEGDR